MTGFMKMVPGQILGERYEILSVHPGGMGVVAILRDRETGEVLAAKTVKEEARGNPRVLSRFEREVKTWIGLGRHENLVAALHFREIEGLPLLFLEYVDGPTLASLLRADGPLSLPQALDLAIQCARGISFAHERPMGGGSVGLVHRDLKPENLFVTKGRVAKVSDLGIAKLLAADLEATAEGIGMGTPWYVSPEQLKSSRDVDARADVYSFGAVLYEMTTGAIPLKAESLESQIYMILRARPEPPSRLNPRIPAPLDRLLLRCLEKDPAERPATFRELATELVEIAAGAERADPPRSTCTACAYASAHEPATCPICTAPMGPPRPYLPVRREGVAPGAEARPAEIVVLSTDVQPRPVRVGEPLTVTVAVSNRGTVPARRVEIVWPVPDTDIFRLVADDTAWRGAIPPTGAGGVKEFRYGLVPLREGTYALPPVEVRWRSDGAVRTARGGGETKIPVTFNYHLPLVGREAAVAAVEERLARVGAGFVLVEGEAGSGRSRFLAEAAARFAERGWRVIRGKGLERSREPMKVFHDVARDVFGIGPDPLSGSSLMARVIDRLAPLVGEDPAMAGHFAAFLRGAELAESQAAIRGYLWFRLLASLAREAPVALVLDDLQWADEESLDLAETLVRRAGEEEIPLVVVGSTLTTDPEERTRRRIAWLKDRFSALATNPGLTTRVGLEPLSARDVGRLVDAVFPGNTLLEDHPWLRPALVTKSGGNPFHLVQILKMLREARDERGEPLVSAEGGSWMLRPEVTEATFADWIPEAVEDMVRALIRPLPERAREVLEIAAAIGEVFEVGLLEAVLEGRTDVEECLDELEQADLVRTADESGEKLRFTNSLLPSILEQLVRSRSRRAHVRLHRSLARALEATLSPRELRRAGMRYARHLLTAGERERAFPWLVHAAEGFVRQQLYLRAETALHRAGLLLDEGIRPAKATLGNYYYLRGEVSRVTGKLTEALEAFNQAVEHLSGAKGRTTLARTMSKMGKIHEVRGEIDRALFCYQLGAQIREDIGDPSEMAHSLVNLGAVHLLRGEEEKARAAFLRGRELAEKSNNRQALGNALDRLAELATRRGRWEEGESLYRESLTLAESVMDRVGMARSLNGLGGLGVRRGDLAGAREHYQRAIEIRREVGDREGVANILSNLGVIHDRMGDYEEALRYYRRSAEAHRAIGSRRGLATVLNNIGVVNLTRGDVGMAIERFEEALSIRREIGDRSRIGLALQNLGEALALAGRTARGLECLDEALEVCRATGDTEGEGSVRAGRGAVRRRSGDADAAVEEISAGLAGEARDPRVRALLHLEFGEVLLDRGDPDGAERAARRGRELAAEGGDRLGEAHAHHLLGRVLDARGKTEDALAELARAEGMLAGTSGPELLRVWLSLAGIRRRTDPAGTRDLLMRARGLLDALEARGAVLSERERLDRWLAD